MGHGEDGCLEESSTLFVRPVYLSTLCPQVDGDDEEQEATGERHYVMAAYTALAG